MKRLEIFPREERRLMTSELREGYKRTYFASLTEERIYRLKQLLLKYSRSTNEETFDSYRMSCPLCESFLDDQIDLHKCCTFCPWRDKYQDRHYICEYWAEDNDLFSINHIKNPGHNPKILKRRIKMIYQWLEEYMEEL